MNGPGVSVDDVLERGERGGFLDRTGRPLARQGDRRRHDERDVLLQPVREDGGPRLDPEDAEIGARARVADGEVDWAGDARLRLGHQRAQIERERAELGREGGGELVVDPGRRVGDREPAVRRRDLHFDRLELHRVFAAHDWLGDDMHVDREGERVERHRNLRLHPRVEGDPPLGEADVQRCAIPRVVPIAAEERERAVARARHGVLERGLQRRGGDREMGHDPRRGGIREGGRFRGRRARGVHRAEARARRREGDDRCEEEGAAGAHGLVLAWSQIEVSVARPAMRAVALFRRQSTLALLA